MTLGNASPLTGMVRTTTTHTLLQKSAEDNQLTIHLKSPGSSPRDDSVPHPNMDVGIKAEAKRAASRQFESDKNVRRTVSVTEDGLTDSSFRPARLLEDIQTCRNELVEQDVLDSVSINVPAEMLSPDSIEDISLNILRPESIRHLLGQEKKGTIQLKLPAYHFALAVEKGDAAKVQSFIQQYSSEPTMLRYPIAVASHTGNLDALNLMIAQVSQETKFYALEVAVYSNQPEAVRAILQQTKNLIPFAKTASLLRHTVISGYTQVLDSLLDVYGSHISPAFVSIACHRQNKAIVELLLRAGQKYNIDFAGDESCQSLNHENQGSAIHRLHKRAVENLKGANEENGFMLLRKLSKYIVPSGIIEKRNRTLKDTGMTVLTFNIHTIIPWTWSYWELFTETLKILRKEYVKLPDTGFLVKDTLIELSNGIRVSSNDLFLLEGKHISVQYVRDRRTGLEIIQKINEQKNQLDQTRQILTEAVTYFEESLKQRNEEAIQFRPVNFDKDSEGMRIFSRHEKVRESLSKLVSGIHHIVQRFKWHNQFLDQVVSDIHSEMRYPGSREHFSLPMEIPPPPPKQSESDRDKPHKQPVVNLMKIREERRRLSEEREMWLACRAFRRTAGDAKPKTKIRQARFERHQDCVKGDVEPSSLIRFMKLMTILPDNDEI